MCNPLAVQQEHQEMFQEVVGTEFGGVLRDLVVCSVVSELWLMV